MKNILKNIILKVVSKEQITNFFRSVKFVKNYTDFISNYYSDAKLYYKYSSIYHIDSYDKIEAKIILHYHSIEKGLIHKNLKPRFAKDKVSLLHKHLSNPIIVENISKSQIQNTLKILLQYYKVHQELNINIEDYFNKNQLEKYSKLIEFKEENFKGVLTFNKLEFYNDNQSNFCTFSNSRKSIRNFTGEKVDIKQLEKAIELSLNSPSVCNRQSSKVYLLEDYNKIQEVLKIQGGFAGFSKNVSQLLIVTSNRSFFYTLGERNQFYVDGGIYLMNLLYCLHYYKIANCPANWGKPIKAESKLDKIIKLPKEEKIICLVPIGVAESNFSVPLSKRRDLNEVLIKI